VAEPYYQRLTQIDNSFLVYEDTLPECATHVASTQIHEAAPLRRQSGEIDIDRIEEYVLWRLDRIPRYRQRLATTPIERHPVWVDDATFNIRYHVRHSRLPHPGSERQLKRMIGRIFSQRLDREKPLWELWVIEGLEGDRVAVFSKVHHCMVDGVSGSELIAALLTPEPVEKPEPPARWSPRPVPTRIELGAGEAARALRAPFQLGSALRRLARDEGGARHHLAERMRAMGRLIAETRGVTPVPFNRPVGPHRRIDWLPMSLARIKEVRENAGGTVNDVVLAIASGAIGRFLARQRGVDLAKLRFRAMAPVSVRTPEQRGTMGKRVSAWTVELPVAVAAPVERLEIIRRETEHLKQTKQALGAETLTQVTEWTGSGLLSLGARLANLGTPFSTVITNIPGPRTPLYLMESPLLEIHPHVPLMGTLGLGIALFSYDGTLSWGFSADWDLVPDVHELVRATERSLDELQAGAAGAHASRSRSEPEAPPTG
jgi:WS/DGAT/MGAT family acyltransferase